jgi:hypothetical protein
VEKLAAVPPMICGVTVLDGAVEVLADGVGEGVPAVEDAAPEEFAAAFLFLDACLTGPAVTVVR